MSENFGWILGYSITIAVVLVVVALVVPILVLAASIGKEAKMINDSLTQSVHNTAALKGLNTTIDHAEVIVAGLEPRTYPARRLTMPSDSEFNLTPTQESLWWGAIIGGAAIVVAVALLLTILVVLVRRIDKRVVMVRDTLRAAAANTADTALIEETAKRVDAVLAEGLQHHLFLGRVLDKVRS